LHPTVEHWLFTSRGRRGLKCSFKAVKEQRTTLLFKETIEMVIFAVSKMSLAESKSQKSDKAPKEWKGEISHKADASHRPPPNHGSCFLLELMAELGQINEFLANRGRFKESAKAKSFEFRPHIYICE
jgi:hypothetical protein